MSSNKRPDNMERITTPELAAKFIEEQVGHEIVNVKTPYVNALGMITIS